MEHMLTYPQLVTAMNHILEHTAYFSDRRTVDVRALGVTDLSDTVLSDTDLSDLSEEARPALLGSWDNFQGPSQTRMRHSAC